MIYGLFERKKTKKELFKEVYEENYDYVYRFIYSRLGGSKPEIEDVLQETFISALKGIESFRAGSSYRTWLCSIARHKLIDLYRKEIGESIEYSDDMDSHMNYRDVEEEILLIEDRIKVKEALKMLPPIYRYSLILKYVDDMSIKDIANVIERTPKAVDGVLQRAKKEFKNIYSDLLEGCNERR